MLTRTNIAPPLAAGRNVLGALRRGLPRMRAAVEAWLRRTRQRRALIRLGDGLLRDIGLSPDCLPQDEERRTCSVPFRLPRQ